METLTQQYNQLKAVVEKAAGRKMCTPRDFDFLAMRIFDTTRTYMSPTTLKRFWGYLNNGKSYQPRKSTLDLLSIYVGYKDFDSYCLSSSGNNSINSDYIKSPTLYVTSLAKGNIVKLMWDPNRCVRVKYLGDDMFEVVESVNSKLSEGDRFCCGCFIDGEPLYLTRLVRNDQALGAYVCGQDGGIKFFIENGGVSYCNTDDYALCRDSSATIKLTIWALIGSSPQHQVATLVNATSCRLVENDRS